MFFASVPIGLYLTILRWIGLEQRVSIWRLMSAVTWGAAGGIALGLLWATGLGRPLQSLLLPGELAMVESVFTVPLAEELAKGVVFVLLIRQRRVGSALLGVLYGVSAGLGFAMTENFAYFLNTWLAQGGEAWYATVVLRTFFSGMLHASATGLWGLSLGHGLTHGNRHARRLLPYIGLFAALIIHGGWNLCFVLTGVSGYGLPLGVGLISVPIVVCILITMSSMALRWESQLIRAELSEEEQAGNLPEHHSRILANVWARRRQGWLPPHVPQQQYLRTALGLVMARREARSLGQDPNADGARLSDCRRALAALNAPAGEPPGKAEDP